MDHKDDQISNLIAAQSKLEAVVEALAGHVNSIANDIRQLADYNRTKAQTNWGNVFAGVTLMILLVTGYVGLPLQALSEQVDRLTHTTTEDLGASNQRIYQILGRFDEEFQSKERRIDRVEQENAKTNQRLESLEREIFDNKRGC